MQTWNFHDVWKNDLQSKGTCKDPRDMLNQLPKSNAGAHCMSTSR